MTIALAGYSPTDYIFPSPRAIIVDSHRFNLDDHREQ